jgi:hypothetical protein
VGAERGVDGGRDREQPETVDNRATMATAGGAQVVVGVLAAATAAWGCAAHMPAPSSGPPPVAPAPAAPPPRECGPTDRDYEAWFRRTFGGSYGAFLDGPDPARIRDVVGEPRAEAARMLRRGLDACSTVAVSAIEGAGWRDLVPDLTRAVATLGSPQFRAHVIVALKVLGSRDDFSGELIGVLGAGPVQARITAAMGARHFSLERFRGPLLDRVRQDTSSLVRYHAAESLLELADIYPRELGDHPALMAAMAGKSPKNESLLEALGVPAPLTAEERARLAGAADQLDAEIRARLAEGRCSKPVVPSGIDLHVIPVRDPHIVTLTVEESIGSCERKLAFVVFLESPAGFGRWLEAGSSGRDPFRVQIKTVPNPVTVSYSRGTRLLIVGTFTLDTSKANVAVVSARANGVVARYRQELDLTFARDGHPPPWTGMGFLDAQPEITVEVRKLLARVPELQGLVTGVPAGGASGD